MSDIMQYQKEYFDKISTKDHLQFRRYLELLKNCGVEMKNKKILDIGCATGNFIEQLEMGSEYYGWDFSEYAIAECKKKFSGRADCFKRVDLNGGSVIDGEIKFDIITIFDVLEHLYNFSVLKEIIDKRLTDNGTLIITTPNANSLTRLLKLKSFTGEKDRTHTMLFTPFTLDFFLRRLGLRRVALYTPYIFYFKTNVITSAIPFGGQIFAVYQK